MFTLLILSNETNLPVERNFVAVNIAYFCNAVIDEGCGVRWPTARKTMTCLLILIIIAVLFYFERPAFLYSLDESAIMEKKLQTIARESTLMARCGIAKSIYGLPTPTSFLNISELAMTSEMICRLTKDVDPIELLKVCNNGQSPRLVSKNHIPRPDSDKDEAFLVPNVVHYVYGYPLANKPMTFLMYISFLSVQRFIRPRYIFIHGDALPNGEWWNRAINDVDNIYFVDLTSAMPNRIFGIPLSKPEHVADIVRMDAIYKIGGMYFDLDVIVLRSFDELRNYQFTLGHEKPKATPNLIMIGQPCAPFVLHWIDSYRDFNPNEWAFHSVHLPYRLGSTQFPHLVHFEEDSLVTPKWGEFDKQHKIGHLYNWSSQYSTHIWKRYVPVPKSLDDIKKLNSTIGQMMRHVYYGTTDFVL